MCSFLEPVYRILHIYCFINRCIVTWISRHIHISPNYTHFSSWKLSAYILFRTMQFTRDKNQWLSNKIDTTNVQRPFVYPVYVVWFQFKQHRRKNKKKPLFVELSVENAMIPPPEWNLTGWNFNEHSKEHKKSSGPFIRLSSNKLCVHLWSPSTSEMTSNVN